MSDGRRFLPTAPKGKPGKVDREFYAFSQNDTLRYIFELENKEAADKTLEKAKGPHNPKLRVFKVKVTEVDDTPS